MKTFNGKFVVSKSVYRKAMEEIQEEKTLTEDEIIVILNKYIELSFRIILIDADHFIIFPYRDIYGGELKINERNGILLTETLEKINPNLQIPEVFSLGQMLDKRFQRIHFNGDNRRTLMKLETHVFLINLEFLTEFINILEIADSLDKTNIYM